MPDVSLNGIEFTIKGGTDAASESIDKLIKKLNGLKSALKDTGGIKTTASSINSLRSALEKMSQVDMKRITNSLKGLGNISNSLKGLADVSKDISSFARSMAKLGENPENLGDVAQWLSLISQIDFSNLQSAGAAIRDITKASKDISQKDRTKENSEVPMKHGLSDFFTAERITGEESGSLAYALDGLRVGLIGIASGALSAAKGIGSALVSALQRAASAVQSLAKFISGVLVSALKATASAAKNVAMITGNAFISPFKRAASNVAGFTKKLGSVASALKRIMGYRVIRSIIKEIGQAFDFGIKRVYLWSNAIGETFSKSMDKAYSSLNYFKDSIGAAVAPLINALVPALQTAINVAVSFINVLNQLFALLGGQSYWLKAEENADSYKDSISGLGGAAKKAKEYLAPFDELNKLPDNSGGGGGGSNKVLEEGDFVKTEFDTKLKDFVDNIKKFIADTDWQGLGQFIGEKINELIESINWRGIGEKFGEFINAIFTTKYWLFDTINFVKIGNSIAELLNGAMSKIDFEYIGRGLVQNITAILDTIIGIFEGLDWKLVAKSVGDLLGGAFDEATEWINSIDWVDMGESVTKAFTDFVNGYDWAGLAKKMFDAIGAAFSAVSAFAGDIFGNLAGWIGNALYDAVTNDDGTAKTGEEIWNGICEGIKKGFSTITTWIKTNIVDPFVSGFKTGFGNSVTADMGETIWNGITSGLKTAVSKANSWIKTNVIDKVKGFFNSANVGTLSVTMKTNLSAFKLPDLKTFKANWNAIKSKTVTLTSKLKGAAIKTFSSLKTYWAGVYNKAATLTASVKKSFNENVLATLKNAWETVKNKTATFTAKLSAGGVVKTFIDGWNKLTSKTLSLSVTLSNTVKSAWNKAAGAWNGNKITSKLGTLPYLAKGGIVDQATLIGNAIAGEDGKEAIIPLERNTEWIGMVASGLIRELGGFTGNSDNYDKMADAMYRAMSRALTENPDDRDIYLDGDVVYRKMVQRNRNETFIRGVNPMMSMG